MNTKTSLTFDIFSNQVQVGGKKNSVILQKLTPDTPYSITVAAVYRTGESKDISGQGKTSRWLQDSLSTSWSILRLHLGSENNEQLI